MSARSRYKISPRLIVLMSALAVLLPAPVLASLYPSSAQLEDTSKPLDSSARIAKRGKRRRARSKKAPPPPPTAQAPAPPAASNDSGSGGAIMTTRRGPARVDFDDRLIQGQTNKSGAIYIFERKSSELHSMVRRRTSFRDEILRSIE